MTAYTRPRPEEFFLALLWIVGTGWWGYFGLVGYAQHLINFDRAEFNLAGFISSFLFLCLTVFGLRFSFNIFLRLWRNAPKWVGSFSSLTLGITLLVGGLFSLFTLGIAIYKLFFTDRVSDFVFMWGLAACLGITGLMVYQFLAALNSFEPFLGWAGGEQQGQLHFLRDFQRRLHGKHFGPFRAEEELRGPLLMESDNRTNVYEEKADGRPGLEKIMVAHGGYHISMLGFGNTNNSTVFSVSDGGKVHYEAGGRKGTMFPPELKFWDWTTDKVQLATLGEAQTFLTRDYKTPESLQSYRFLVPQSGAKFAWVTPNQIQVGHWQTEQVQILPVEDQLMLRGINNFSSLIFNPEGSRLAWCLADGQTRLWNLENEQVQPLRAYPVEENNTDPIAGVWGVVFNPDGTRIATLGGQGILLQNVYTGWRWFRPLEMDKERLTAFAFSGSGFEMAVGMQARLETLQLAERRKSDRRAVHTNGLVGTEPAPQIQTTFSQELVPIVRLWDLREDRFVDLLIGSSPLRELTYSLDNTLLAGVDESGIMRIWEIGPEGSNQQTPRLVVEVDLGLSGRKVVLTFAPDKIHLIGSTDNRVLLWNIKRLRKEAKPN